MNAYTTIEESKKLLDLGLNPESADFEYKCVGFTMHTARPTDDFKYKVMLKEQNIPHEPKYDIPCWSLSALLGIINSNNLVYDISNDKNREFEILVYEANYISQEVKFHHTEHSIVDMITWLLENNYIKSNKNE